MLQHLLRLIYDWTGRAALVFLFLLLAYVLLGWLLPGNGLRLLAALGMFISGLWVVIRMFRRAARQAIWSLRNRLVVTYLFISIVPILLVAALATLGGYSLVSQLAVYLVTSEMDRRIAALSSITDSVVRTDPESRPAAMQRTIDLFYRDRYPGIEVVLREAAGR